ncbi:hypothetical protein MYMAC_005989 [Corallococcus macrosporus DSM 14697]|uniref:Uncharacterized protein n=1 Tax=Corallococcus macrosporus DSM 14697 TaxID=1189310 RepID=A0A250K2M0_9BACT|nr:hypothetical protein MYMAC_005989 [Corallococcus macrosporus DSM 14697]
MRCTKLQEFHTRRAVLGCSGVANSRNSRRSQGVRGPCLRLRESQPSVPGSGLQESVARAGAGRSSARRGDIREFRVFGGEVTPPAPRRGAAGGGGIPADGLGTTAPGGEVRATASARSSVADRACRWGGPQGLPWARRVECLHERSGVPLHFRREASWLGDSGAANWPALAKPAPADGHVRHSMEWRAACRSVARDATHACLEMSRRSGVLPGAIHCHRVEGSWDGCWSIRCRVRVCT